MKSTELANHFSNTYQIARQRVLDASIKKQARLDKLKLDVAGPSGEDLTVDIAWFGSSTPENVLIHISGIHGVEGFAGSAIQIKMIEELPKVEGNNAIIFVHILNPYGMAWLRRFNENNVDLNRNFLAPPDKWIGMPELYKKLNNYLNPKKIHFIDTYYIEAIINLFKYGIGPLKQAIAGGQYENPTGIFFGGKQLEQGPALYKAWLDENLSSAKRLFIIDVHTGLGKWCQNSLLHKLKGNDSQELPKEVRKNIITDKGETFYKLRGAHAEVYKQLFDDIKIDFVLQEFGTYPSVRNLKALRAENHLHVYGDRNVNHPRKIALKNAFFPDSDEWKVSVLQDGTKLFRSAIIFSFNH